ncbi:MAG: DUF1987 domain-containing protein [Bacteroidetes bacterium]|jgi:hypothetical protein|nr:DUF1987 domain-containing protein [Bacteroidota bacterium]
MKWFSKNKSDIQALTIEPTNDMPGVVFDKGKSKFEIYGVALPENVIEEFAPIISWLDEYEQNPNSKTVFHFRLDYINTASSKMIDKIMTKLNNIYLVGFRVKVCWHYKHGDVDMQELGDELLSGYDFSKELVSD